MRTAIAAALALAMSAPAIADPLPTLKTYDTCASVGNAPECWASETNLSRSLNRVAQPLWDEADAALRAKCVARTDMIGDMISCLEGH